MKVDFYKYHGTGNDFIIIDNRDGAFSKNNTNARKQLCDRRFGIGADGLILLEADKFSDFAMVYYNSDGNESTMCGNGGRCIVSFAKRLGLIGSTTTFNAIDGSHSATIDEEGLVRLQMNDVENISISKRHVFLDTGSPHHVEYLDDIESVNVKVKGSEIRYSGLYGKAGSNVNFVRQDDTEIFSIRTYERGVEDETLSCGTGAVAVAIASHALGKTNSEKIHINVEGGELEVSFTNANGTYRNVYLSGPAEFVYKGMIDISKW